MWGKEGSPSYVLCPELAQSPRSMESGRSGADGVAGNKKTAEVAAHQVLILAGSTGQPATSGVTGRGGG